VRHGVLIIEDDADLREMVSQLLAQEGFKVSEASNGREALEKLRAGLRPAIILLDLMMPVMDGWTFRREQVSDSALADIPVVVGTAAPLRKAMELNAVAILQKPYDFDEAISILRRYSR